MPKCKFINVKYYVRPINYQATYEARYISHRASFQDAKNLYPTAFGDAHAFFDRHPGGQTARETLS